MDIQSLLAAIHEATPMDIRAFPSLPGLSCLGVWDGACHFL